MSIDSDHRPPIPQSLAESFWEKAARVLEGDTTEVILYERAPVIDVTSVELGNARNEVFKELGYERDQVIMSEYIDMSGGAVCRIVRNEYVLLEWPSVRAVIEYNEPLVIEGKSNCQQVSTTALFYKPGDK